MSIYTGLEATIRILRENLKGADNRIIGLAEELGVLQVMHNKEQHKSVALTARVEVLTKRFALLKRERDSYAASDKSTNESLDKMYDSNDALQDRIETFHASLKIANETNHMQAEDVKKLTAEVVLRDGRINNLINRAKELTEKLETIYEVIQS